MLFVHDDETEAIERREDGRPRADDEVHLAAPDAMPLVVTLAAGERAVLDGDTVAKDAAEQRGDRRCECDLGDHQQDLPARLACAPGETQVELGLAAAGHPVQQRDPELSGVGEREQLAGGAALLAGQLARGVVADAGHRRALEGVAFVTLVAEHDQAAFDEAAQHRGGDAAIAKLGGRQPGVRGGEDGERGFLPRSQTPKTTRLNPSSRPITGV